MVGREHDKLSCPMTRAEAALALLDLIAPHERCEECGEVTGDVALRVVGEEGAYLCAACRSRHGARGKETRR